MGVTGDFGIHGDKRKAGIRGQYGVHGSCRCGPGIVGEYGVHGGNAPELANVLSVVRDGLAPALIFTLDRAVEPVDLSSGIAAIQAYIPDGGGWWMACWRAVLDEVTPGTGYRIVWAEWDVALPAGEVQWRVSGPTPEVSPAIAEASGTASPPS